MQFMTWKFVRCSHRLDDLLRLRHVDGMRNHGYEQSSVQSIGNAIKQQSQFKCAMFVRTVHKCQN